MSNILEDRKQFFEQWPSSRAIPLPVDVYCQIKNQTKTIPQGCSKKQSHSFALKFASLMLTHNAIDGANK